MIGLNLSHAAAGLPADTVASWGSDVARFPLHAERDARPAITALIELGVKPLPVFVREAFEVGERTVRTMESYRDELGDLCDWWQVCNEPDGTSEGEAASWVMSQSELNVWLSEARRLFPRPIYTLFGPGLVSGDADWLQGVRLDLVEYVCPHPYNKLPHTQALRDLLQSYLKYRKPLWITEVDSRVEGLPEYLDTYPGIQGQAVFCGHSYLNFGLIDYPARLADYLALTGGEMAKPWSPPAWIGDGLKAAIQRDGATPLSGEGSFPMVLTDKGMYVWSQLEQRARLLTWSTAPKVATIAPLDVDLIRDPHALDTLQMRQAGLQTARTAEVILEPEPVLCAMGDRLPLGGY